MKALVSLRRNIIHTLLFVSVAVVRLQLNHWLLLPPPRAAAVLNHHSAAQAKTKAQHVARYGQLPLRFEANRGQTDRAVKFIARGSGYALFLAPQEAVLRLRNETRRELSTDQSAPAPSVNFAPPSDSHHLQHSVVRLKLAGANPEPLVTGVEPLAAKSHYLLGNDPRLWQTEVANFAKVKYASVYPGIDLLWYGNERQLEHDFIVAPGADPRRIKLELAGASRLALNARGDLLVDADGGQMQLLKPRRVAAGQ